VPVEIMGSGGETLRPGEDGVLLSNGRVREGITGEGGEDILGEGGVKPADTGDEPGNREVL
jgi:hypothetical protein